MIKKLDNKNQIFVVQSAWGPKKHKRPTSFTVKIKIINGIPVYIEEYHDENWVEKATSEKLGFYATLERGFRIILKEEPETFMEMYKIMDKKCKYFEIVEKLRKKAVNETCKYLNLFNNV